MILIWRFRRSLATAQTNRFALRLARDSAQRGRLCRSRAFTPMGLWSYYFWEAHLSGAESVGYAFLSGIRFRCGQHKQSQPRQAKQQAGKNHKNDPHSLDTKAPLKELRGFSFTVELGAKPTVKGVAVVDPLLSCKGRKAFSSNSGAESPRRTAVHAFQPTVLPGTRSMLSPQRPGRVSAL